MSRRKGRKARQGRAGRLQAVASRIGRSLHDGVKVLVVSDYTPGDSPWIDGWAERLLAGNVPQCEHLSRRPGAGFLHSSEGYGRCLDCHRERVASEAVWGLLSGCGGAECGRCGASVDPALLRPVVVELGSWVLVSALCPVCAAVLLHEGRRGPVLADSASGVR